MEFPESDLMQTLPKQFFAALVAKVNKKIAEGYDVINLGQGNPDQPTFDYIIEGLKEAAERPINNKYSQFRGQPTFKKACAAFYQEKYGVELDSEKEICVLGGSKIGLVELPWALMNPGDTIILPDPGYPDYLSGVALGQVKLETVPLKAENDFLPDYDDIPEDVARKAKFIYLNYPNNPTGAVMEKKDLEAVAEVIKKHDLFVLSDEIYCELTYLEKHVSIASLPGMRERTIVVNGFSKSHAMTGWRLGYAYGPAEIIKQMLKIHQFAIMCAPTTSQYAAVEALKNGDEDVAMMREQYDARRRYLMERFKEMGLECFEPFGAFYVFPCIKEFGMTSDEFANRLLQTKKVAVVPGTAFGDSGEGFIRISYAYSLDDLKIALERVEEFITELRANK